MTCTRPFVASPRAALGLVVAALLTGCRAAPSRHAAPLPTGASRLVAGASGTQDPWPSRVEPWFPLEWLPGQTLLQGNIGARYLSNLKLDSGDSSIQLDDDEYEVLPTIGGGAQLKLVGEDFDLGLEGMLSFAGRSDLEAFATSGGTTVAAFDVTLLVIEAYGGPFVSRFLGERLRLYGAAGPLLTWVTYDPDDDDTGDAEGAEEDGSGGGLYARAGFEFLMPSGNLAGLGVRWTESSIDLGADLGDLELSGFEVVFTYAYGLQPRSRFDW